MRTRPTTRPAFTLVEMMIAIALTLVVMLIIAVLISLGMSAVMQTRKVQETNNTKTLITKVDQALQKRWLATIETARNETPCPVARNLAGFGTAVYDATAGTVTFTPAQLGDSTFEYGLIDALGASSTITVKVHTVPLNDPPVAVDDPTAPAKPLDGPPPSPTPMPILALTPSTIQ